MSSIKLTADSGGGTFELKAPSSGSNARVLTVPDTASGTVLTTTNPKAGNIIQVVQTLKTDTFSTNSYGYTDVTGLSVTITPTSANNKILILVQVTCGGPSNERAGFRIFKDGSTAIGGGDASGNRLTGFGSVYRNDSNGIQSLPASVIDTPGDTNAHTYAVQVSILMNNSSMYINRTEGDSNNYYAMRTSSSITAMEVAA